MRILNRNLERFELFLLVFYGALILSGFWAMTDLPASATLRRWWGA
jgi:hypothetical protein